MNDQSPASSVDGDIAAIEEALVAQWSMFGHAPGGVWHEADDLVWTEAPVPQLPYNAVLRTRLESGDTRRIDDVIAHFRRRGVQFMWIDHPTAEPQDLAERLKASRLSLVENVTGMSLDLASWQDPGPCKGQIRYREVSTESDLDAFEKLMVEYWELPQESRSFAFRVSRWAYETKVPGVRWLAFREDEPIGKAYLSLVGLEDTAAIFGVYVRPDARGKGVAQTLNELAIRCAVDLGMKRVVLHSSEMAVNVYRRLGFLDRCTLSVYATTSLHSSQPT